MAKAARNSRSAKMASEDVLELAAKAQKMIPRAIDVFEQAVFIGSVVDDLAAEVRELRKDKARLDFILEEYAIELPHYSDLDARERWLETREDIDAAMGEGGSNS